MHPCWAALLTTRTTAETEPDARNFAGAFVNEGPISWLARDSSKPGRNAHTDPAASLSRCVLHASAPWSRKHLESEPAEVRTALISAMQAALGCSLDIVGDVVIHRWRHAMPVNPIDQGHLW